ncbi:winged helix-turn-helix domain-containing protein, partial [Streptomyces griseolus]|uniref:winged helix-turn-helix domain-containing protein n=1 Tax=Streptomyces griseolus TaxID=1909 RepID=UPI0022441CF8
GVLSQELSDLLDGLSPLSLLGGELGGEPERRGLQAQRAQAVEKVAELLAQDPGLTSAKVAERLNVSAATAKRYLREARQT